MQSSSQSSLSFTRSEPTILPVNKDDDPNMRKENDPPASSVVACSGPSIPTISTAPTKRKRTEKRTLKEGEYEFAKNASGIDDHLLIVREEDDPTMAREYLYNKSKFYYCRACKKSGKANYASAHNNAEGELVIRVPLNENHIPTCQPMSYERLKAEAENRVVVSTNPPKSRKRQTNNSTETKPPKIVRESKKKNVSASTQGSNFDWAKIIANERSAKIEDEQLSNLPNLPVNFQHFFQTLMGDSSEVPSENKMGDVPSETTQNVDNVPETVMTTPELNNMSSFDVLQNLFFQQPPKMRIIPVQDWHFGVDKNGKTNGIIFVRLHDDNSKVRCYDFLNQDDFGSINYKCSCKQNGNECVVSLIHHEKRILAIETGIHLHEDDSCVKNYEDVMYEQAEFIPN
uniref:Uncharacterized protein n=1 Tax=Panagrolaimus sp. JU765 TaxID=591449 RepID=A0AC34RND8_9BILA